MMLFTLLLSFVIVQRMIEIGVAKRNERWALQQGAVEFGANHYKYILLLHLFFFLSLLLEYLLSPQLTDMWFIFLTLFLLAQILRIWTLRSLGKYWNTKVLIIPNEKRVTKGPYQYVQHPNYLIVAIEFLTLPLIFGAYLTALTFSILNFLLLYFIRIPIEEKALQLLETPESYD